MRTLKLVNVNIMLPNAEFEFNGYRFIQDKHIYHNAIFNNKRYYQNGRVTFSDSQKDSIIMRDIESEVGLRGDPQNPQKRKRIDDLLLLCSLFTGQNWNRYADRGSRGFPIYPINYCEDIQEREEQQTIHEYLKIAMEKVIEPAWQTQFENGVHLRMMLNRSNILNLESRFISYIVIWEWLYPHLKNTYGATVNDENDKLYEIIPFVLEKSFNVPVTSVENFYHKLRNQLAHSGTLPIDRKRSKKYHKIKKDDILDLYIPFFEKLTQVIVLKTLGINAEHIISSRALKNYLEIGDPFPH